MASPSRRGWPWTRGATSSSPTTPRIASSNTCPRVERPRRGKRPVRRKGGRDGRVYRAQRGRAPALPGGQPARGEGQPDGGGRRGGHPAYRRAAGDGVGGGQVRRRDRRPARQRGARGVRALRLRQRLPARSERHGGRVPGTKLAAALMRRPARERQPSEGAAPAGGAARVSASASASSASRASGGSRTVNGRPSP